MKINKSDWKYVPVDPEEGFSAEHNQRVIDRTIKKSEEYRRKREKEFDDNLRERSSALAQYLKSLQSGKSTSVEEYFGKSYLTHLKGQNILERIKRAKEKKESEVA